MFILKNLKMLQNVSINCSVWRGMPDCSPAYLSTQNVTHTYTHTKCYATASPNWHFTFLTNF